MRIWLLLVVLASVIAWVLAVVAWVHHDDHAALGWFAFSVVSSNYVVANLRQVR